MDALAPLRDLLLDAQLPLAAALASWLFAQLQRVALVRQLGDWAKRIALALSAGLILLAVRWIGGEPHPDLLTGLGLLTLGGSAAAAPAALAFRLGRSTPPITTPKGPTMGLRSSFPLLAAITLIACAAARPPVDRPMPIPSPNAIVVTASVTDSAVRSQGGCKLVPGAVNCRWEVFANGTAIPVPDGLTFVVSAPQPQVGDSLVYTARLRYLSPTGIPSASWSAAKGWKYVRNDQAPPVAVVDSITTITVTVVPTDP
jgi:hypothetical protein